ncbi:membrane-associated phospholipid phosphatase/rhodanese-related sulfurtransferase [Chryseobacterium sp. H1D6B]|uniref:phosphatase PAP2 family protein n=1 Tax=Chryseobacterium sp. H1D6B TaxID=2940588 RepID=UPI0015CDA10F|nr:phosphatase PAP2 family protein [Chryseobacterium sp. H1D6B]MDH6251011.1 membrane-associated phospholipid phosphatase/rhodanese-related sulfurtransferase [Chryseobacterium sp. H1D6B]
MDEKRLTIKQKTASLVLCSAIFILVYNYATWHTSKLDRVPSFVFDFEKWIPFIPWTIIPYMTSGLFFCAVFFFCSNKQQLQVLTKRLLFVTITAGIGFMLFPLKFSLLKPEINNSIFTYPFQFLNTFDSSFNQAPSLHIAYAFIFWTIFKDLKKWRIFSAVWLVLLGASTLTTYQHHFIDVITGVILAHLSFILVPYQKNNFLYRNYHIANFYFLFGYSFFLLSLLSAEYLGVLWLILVWPALVMLFIGYHYQKNEVCFLKDKNGNIPVYKRIFYSPYLLLYWIFWKFLRKNKKPLEIADSIYISSRPDDKDLECFIIDKNTFVYDLSAEMEEAASIKKTASYFSVPFLDIGTLNSNETKKLVSEITEKHKPLPKNGKILIHCTMGYTRSSVIGILVMKKILSLPLDEAVTKMKTLNKNTVIHFYLKDFLKKF